MENEKRGFTKPAEHPLTPDSLDRKSKIDETSRILNRVTDFNLETEEGREGYKITLDLAFSNIEAIEGEDAYEVVGSIKEQLREIYKNLYAISFSGERQTPEAAAFYGEISDIMELLEKRGQRFIEDMDEYRAFHKDQMRNTA